MEEWAIIHGLALEMLRLGYQVYSMVPEHLYEYYAVFFVCHAGKRVRIKVNGNSVWIRDWSTDQPLTYRRRRLIILNGPDSLDIVIEQAVEILGVRVPPFWGLALPG